MIFSRPLVDELRRQLEAERMRSASLMDVIVEMRREGFQMPERMEPFEGEDVGLPAPVVDAIEVRGTTRQAKERLMKEARRLLRESDAEAVAEHIMDGEGFAWGA